MASCASRTGSMLSSSTGMIASGLQIYVAFRHFGTTVTRLPVPNPFDGYASRGGPTWWLSRADSTGTSRSPGPRHYRTHVHRVPRPSQGSGANCCSAPVISSRPSRCSLPAPEEGAPAAGEAQRVAEGAHVHRGPRRHLRAERVRHLQAGPAILAHDAFRRLRVRAPLALRRRVALHRSFVHVGAVLLADRASLPSMITGWYRGKFPAMTSLDRRDFLRLGLVAGPASLVAGCGWDGGPS